MRLSLITPRYGHAQGGVGNSAARVHQHLASAHAVTLYELCPDLPPRSLREVSAEHVQVASSGESKQAMQFLVDVLAQRARQSVLCGFYAGPTAFPLWLAARLLESKLVLFARGNDVDLEPFGGEGLKQLHAFSQADLVLCVTRELEHKVRAWAPGARTAYVPNGIDVAAFTAGAPALKPARDARLRLGIFGELKSKKGLEQLLAALDPTRFSLRIVGSLRPDTEKFLHGMLTLEPALAHSVTHVPFATTRQQLLAEYAEVDVVCLPSLHEGMSNVMLEAMALGKAVVASRVGGALDALVHGENAITFEVMREGALAEALSAVERADRAALGAAARRTVEEHYSAALERTRTLAALAKLEACCAACTSHTRPPWPSQPSRSCSEARVFLASAVSSPGSSRKRVSASANASAWLGGTNSALCSWRNSSRTTNKSEASTGRPCAR